MPTAQRSTFSSYFYPCSNSGDRYNGVPQKVDLNYYFLLTAQPKSHNLTFPLILLLLHVLIQCFTALYLYEGFYDGA